MISLAEQYTPVFDPIGDSFALSSIAAAVPLLLLFVLLGGVQMKAWKAALISLAVSMVIAIAIYGMPVDQTFLSATEGATYGFFPILWIVLNAIWVYNLTVATGHFEVLRRSFESVSPDQRIQAIIIAFCFGGLLEALAGFGTPVAISVVMLMALGFAPIKAAVVALIANTAPVAFGALATPIQALSTTTAGADPANAARYTIENLGAMAGRQTPILAALVPLVLVYVVDGKRGLRQTWLPAIVCGVTFGIGQYVCSNFISVQLTDIVASLVGAAAVVLLLRAGWRPSESPQLAVPRGRAVPTVAGGSVRDDGGRLGTAAARDSRSEVIKAYAPYAIIIAIFSIANIPAIKDVLAKTPWTQKFHWPGMDIVGANGQALASTTFTFNWLPAAGTLMVIAGLLTMAVLRVSPARAFKAYVDTYKELRYAIITVMAVLALAYILNQSGMTGSLGRFLAQAGGAFAFLSSILGWIGVAVTGSDTSSNALFGGLQVTAANTAGLDPVLMAAANSSGGVMGKMISPQNLAIAASAVGMAGQEGEIFRKVLGWSLALLLFMCVLVTLQATPVLSWMVPS